MASQQDSQIMWRDWNKLWMHLGFDSILELEVFIAGETSQQFFAGLYNKVIDPEQGKL